MAKQKPNQLIHPKAEQVLRQIILKDLKNKGRSGYDKPHTEAVVFWMKELLGLLNNPGLNSKVLIAAAYAHDWGYAGLFDKSDSRSLSNILDRKKLHMQRGAEKIEQLLFQRLNQYFSDSEKLRIIHLVAVHDKVRDLKDEDELLLMEADTLGMLDVERVPPTFSAEDNKRFMEHSIKTLRLPRFYHQPAKELAEGLIEKRAAFSKG